tara:strand:- start:447 stop:1559 length:1113 start_codon:yes stop_codon:yes gene_type:complete
MPGLKFPSAVEERLGYVSFDVIGAAGAEVNARAEGTDLEQAKENIEKEAEEQGEPSKLQEFFDDAKEVYNDVKGGLEAVDDFLGDAGGKLDGILQDFFGVGEEVQPFVRDKMKLHDPKHQVVLYLPPGFQVAEGVAFDGVDLGAVGALALNSMTKDNVAKAFDGSLGVLGDLSESVIDALKGGGSPEAARLGAIQGAKAFRTIATLGNGGIANAGNLAAGVTIAPNQRTLFKRVNMREFSFSFSLVPSSAEEASAVDSIVDFFRHFLYPEPIMVGAVRVGYKYPEKFKIKVSSHKGWEPVKIQPSYLRNLSVTTNPNGMAFHTDGRPVETQITLNFIESATLDRDQDEYVPQLKSGGGGGGDELPPIIYA